MLTQKEYRRALKNVAQFTAFIDKMEARQADGEQPNLTEDELENLNVRKAQIVVWVNDIRQADRQGFKLEENPNDMSASSAVETAEQAGAEAPAST